MCRSARVTCSPPRASLLMVAGPANPAPTTRTRAPSLADFTASALPATRTPNPGRSSADRLRCGGHEVTPPPRAAKLPPLKRRPGAAPLHLREQPGHRAEVARVGQRVAHVRQQQRGHRRGPAGPPGTRVDQLATETGPAGPPGREPERFGA